MKVSIHFYLIFAYIILHNFSTGISKPTKNIYLMYAQRTPSEDRTNRTWQTSLERALAFLTMKDQR